MRERLIGRPLRKAARPDLVQHDVGAGQRRGPVFLGGDSHRQPERVGAHPGCARDRRQPPGRPAMQHEVDLVQLTRPGRERVDQLYGGWRAAAEHDQPHGAIGSRRLLATGRKTGHTVP